MPSIISGTQVPGPVCGKLQPNRVPRDNCCRRVLLIPSGKKIVLNSRGEKKSYVNGNVNRTLNYERLTVRNHITGGYISFHVPLFKRVFLLKRMKVILRNELLMFVAQLDFGPLKRIPKSPGVP